jgi:hypothetical protein
MNHPDFDAIPKNVHAELQQMTAERDRYRALLAAESKRYGDLRRKLGLTEAQEPEEPVSRLSVAPNPCFCGRLSTAAIMGEWTCGARGCKPQKAAMDQPGTGFPESGESSGAASQHTVGEWTKASHAKIETGTPAAGECENCEPGEQCMYMGTYPAEPCDTCEAGSNFEEEPYPEIAKLVGVDSEPNPFGSGFRGATMEASSDKGVHDPLVESTPATQCENCATACERCGPLKRVRGLIVSVGLILSQASMNHDDIEAADDMLDEALADIDAARGGE